MELLIILIVVLASLASTIRKSGKFDEMRDNMRKKAERRQENIRENVAYEQFDDGQANAGNENAARRQKTSDRRAENMGKKPAASGRIGKTAGVLAAVLIAVFLAFDCYYTLSEEEMAVVTTFGKPAVEEASGLHFKAPLIQKVTKVSKAITGMQIGYTTDPNVDPAASPGNPINLERESLMITKDFNLTNVDFYIEYMVTDPIQAVRHRTVYEAIIKNLAQSYIRDTVGMYNVDDVITTGKTQIQERIKELLTNRLVEENIGYGIYNVSIQDSDMPRDDVSNAFKSVEDAKQGMETAINAAKKYQSENIPKAKAEADKVLQEAEAYKMQRINEANGQVARFEDTYAEYSKYPLITKKRMFYETMEEVLPDLKVIIDNGSGTQTILPLEPFQSSGISSAAPQTAPRSSEPPVQTDTVTPPERN